MVGSVAWEKMANILEHVPCNLCGSSEYISLIQGPDLLLDEKEELFTLVKCRRCGLVFQNPRPTADEIGKYYPDDYEPFFQDTDTNWFLNKIAHYGVDKRSRIINSLPGRVEHSRLLDIGCSTGLFLNTLQKENSWQVWGVEPSEYAADIARNQYNLNVYTGDLFQAKYPEGFFDVVTLWDVLEHVPNPTNTLIEISRITKPQGYLVIRIPNFDSFDAKLFGASWAGLDLPRHTYVFSKKTITKMLELRGFDVVSVKNNIGTYPTFVLSIRFWLTNRHAPDGFKEKIIRILNHPSLRLITAPFFYIYSLLLLGAEITVIARKNNLLANNNITDAN
jgi:2-polyprenyl-3-methyl-5-hydroxy-6-metoxy-1,4-benzoquinol methylase